LRRTHRFLHHFFCRTEDPLDDDAVYRDQDAEHANRADEIHERGDRVVRLPSHGENHHQLQKECIDRSNSKNHDEAPQPHVAKPTQRWQYTQDDHYRCERDEDVQNYKARKELEDQRAEHRESHQNHEDHDDERRRH
jgi:hypothetical protein